MKWIPPQLARRILDSGSTALCLAAGADGRVEAFGNVLLISARGSHHPAVGEAVHLAGERGVSVSRVYERPLVQQPGGRDTPRLLLDNGTSPPCEEVLENGLRLGVEFGSGYNPGVFPDQRDNRVRLRSLKPRRILNTFAHTGAFSVAAALEGAETVSVDASKAFLNRARENFLRNNLQPEGHRFVVEDTATYLRRLARRGETFDMVILDPPTFGRGGGGRVFRFEKDLGDLLRLTKAVLTPRGALLLSTNCGGWTSGHLQRAVRADMRIPARFEEAGVPEDYRDAPLSSGIWVHME